MCAASVAAPTAPRKTSDVLMIDSDLDSERPSSGNLSRRRLAGRFGPGGEGDREREREREEKEAEDGERRRRRWLWGEGEPDGEEEGEW